MWVYSPAGLSVIKQESFDLPTELTAEQANIVSLVVIGVKVRILERPLDDILKSISDGKELL